jgi:hypothetical protein
MKKSKKASSSTKKVKFNLKIKEKRKSDRRKVLDSFHVFITIPKLNPRKIYLRDVSPTGFGIFTDPVDNFKVGTKHIVHFHLNAMLYLPLKVEVRHASSGIAGFMILKDKKFLKSIKLFSMFVEFLNALADYK